VDSLILINRHLHRKNIDDPAGRIDRTSKDNGWGTTGKAAISGRNCRATAGRDGDALEETNPMAKRARRSFADSTLKG